MDKQFGTAQTGWTLPRNQVEAVLSRIRAEATRHGYDIVLVNVRDGMATLMLTVASARPQSPAAWSKTDPISISLDDHLQRVEADMIRWALRTARGNTSKAAELLRMKRSTLHDRIVRCGLRPAHDRRRVSRV
jgi:DNA-binding NtrC family response regulator